MHELWLVPLGLAQSIEETLWALALVSVTVTAESAVLWGAVVLFCIKGKLTLLAGCS